MLFRNIAILDEDFVYRDHMWVGVEGDRITYIDSKEPSSELCARFGEVYEGENKLLIPGFYNAHTHASMTMLRGYAENLPLQEWLFDQVFPFEGQMTAEDNYWASLLACAEMARYGTVSCSDMYYHNAARAHAIAEVGMKGNICAAPISFDDENLDESIVFEEITHPLAVEALDKGQILVDTCIHAEYTSNDVVAKKIIDHTRENGMRLQIHANETKLETIECKERHNGLDPLEWLESLGGLDIPVTIAHCVWTNNDKDIELLKRDNVFVANNPASNMKLASGFAPIPRMFNEGINVCLGTDGMASNNNADMFQEMYLMALIYKGYELDSKVITPEQVLNAATYMGALSQGRKDCGLVKVGFKADLCVIDTSGPSWTPMNNPINNIVFAGHGSDVVMTMSDGRVIYRDNVWPGLDIERIKHEVTTRTNRIKNSI